MADIFISHADADREPAGRLARALEAEGWSVWDPVLPTGLSKNDAMEQALAEARCVLVLWSQASAGDDLVPEVAREAQERRILLAVLLEQVRPPLPYRNFPTDDLSAWDGSPDHEAFRTLVEHVHHMAGEPARAATTGESVSRSDSGSGSPIEAVYLSYAHGEQSQPVVDRLAAVFEERGIELKYDARSLGYGGSVRAFMEEMGDAQCVIVVLSVEYWRSRYCMFELMEMARHPDFLRRVFPVVLRGTPLHEPEDRLACIEHWDRKARALDEQIRSQSRLDHLAGVTDTLNQYHEIRQNIARIMEAIANVNALTEGVHLETDFSALVAAIEKAMGAPSPRAPLEPRLRAADEPIQEAVAARVRKLLQGDVRRPLRQALERALARAGCDAGQGDAAAWICRLDFETVLRVLAEAAGACLDDLRVGGASTDQVHPVCRAAEELLMTLLPLSVDSEWLSRQAGGGVTRLGVLPLTEPASADVVRARIADAPAALMLGPGGAHVVGRNDIAPALGLLESGIEPADAVRTVEQAVWKAVFKDDAPQPFKEAHRKTLKAELRAAMEDGEAHYLTVSLAESGNPFGHQSLRDAVHGALPHLDFVLLGQTDGETVLLVPEPYLIARTRRLLALIRNALDA